MSSETANRLASRLIPAGLLSETVTERLLANPTAGLVVATDGRRVLWSSHMAARRLGFVDGAALMKNGLPPLAAGTERLATLGRSLETETPKRLERLRFMIGFRSLVLTGLCEPLPLADGTLGMLVSLIEAKPARGPEWAGDALEATTLEMFSTPAAIEPERMPAEVPAVSDARVADAKAETASGHTINPQEIATIAAPVLLAGPAWVHAPSEDRRPLRFVFGLDAAGIVERVTPPLASAVGEKNADIVGKSLVDLVAGFDSDAAGALRDAIAGGETWNGIAVRWPVADTTLAVPIDLSALPILSPDDGLTGYSGFGRCHLERAEPIAPSVMVDEADVADETLPAEAEATEEAPRASAAAEADQPMTVTASTPAIDPDMAAALVAFGDEPATNVPSLEAEADEGEPETDAEPKTENMEAAAAAVAMADIPAIEPAHGVAVVQADATHPHEPHGEQDLATADEAAAEVDDAVAMADDPEDGDAELGDTEVGDPEAYEQEAGDTETGDTETSEIESRDTEAEEAVADAPASEAASSLHTGEAVAPREEGVEAPNVVPLRSGQSIPTEGARSGLSHAERNAFREIARALGAKLDFDADETPAPPGAKHAGSNAGPVHIAPVNIASEQETPATAGAGAAPGSHFAPMQPTRPAGDSHPVGVSSFELNPGEANPTDVNAVEAGLLNRLPMGLLVLKGDMPLFANQTLLDLTGYHDFADFITHDGHRAIFRKGTLPRDRDAGFDTIVLAARDGEMMPVDAHLQLVDWQGQKATLISMRRATELEQGKALRTVALDLKRARAESQELRAVLDTATDGVVTLDEKGRILSLNGAAEALFGLSQNEVAGESFTTLLLNESHADALDYLDGLRANGVRSVLNDGREVFGREKKGGRIPLFMTLGRVNDDEPKRYCAVLRDLTAWKRAEADLTEARRAAELASAKKSDFLAKISHEIRTPMNAIIGFAEVMMEERLGPLANPKYQEYLGDIRTSGKHVVSLVNDLLDLAKIEAGRMELNFAATDVNAIVSSCVGIIQPQANANRVLVRTQLAANLPMVVADERSIRQIVLNMLSNATRFTESGGQVIVSTALLDSGEAVIRIRDTGVGMSATEIEQALEPFRQVGTRRDHGGTGLGLPLTKALVEANRANFAIRSAPGEGTMVEITFPSTRVLAE